MKLAEGDEIAAAVKVEEGTGLILVTEKGHGKRISSDLFSTHGRGTGGQRIFGNIDGKGEIIGAVSICDSDEIVCMTSQGKTLRIKATEITIVKVSEPDYLVGIDKVQEKRDNE